MSIAACNSDGQEVWGVLGGLGPLASAEFLRTVYRKNAGAPEQTSPVVILLSDPRIPDRTDAILAGEEQMLLGHLTSGLNQLLSAGATRLVVCCVTLHPLLARLSHEIQARIVSLVDVIFSQVLSASRRQLLICTNGTRAQQTFECHRSWRQAQSLIVCPDATDQNAIHQMLYEIKTGRVSGSQIDYLKELQTRYQVSSYIAGCTEAHLIVTEQERLEGRPSADFCIDPLQEIASMMSSPASIRAGPMSHV